MKQLARLSFSIEKPLLEQLEKLLKESKYSNRSEFIRDMIRQQLVGREWEKDREALGTVTLLYNHHRHKLSEKLTELQHHHHQNILVSTHLHLDKHLCAEVLLVKGRARRIRKLLDLLRRQKGVLHATLSLSSTGKGMA